MNTRRSLTHTLVFAALALAFGLTALPGAGAAGGAKNVTTSVTVPVEESVYNPATGETVNFAGDVRYLVHTKTLADGSVLVSIQDDGLIPGTGDTSGNTYHLMVHDKFRFGFNATGFPFTVTIQCNMHIKNAGSCNDVEVPMTVQFTIQKDGSVTAKYIEDGGGDITP